METIVIGIDAATQPQRVGLCRAGWSGENATLLDPPRCGAKKESIAVTLTKWIEAEASERHRVLLAIDTPLGWPIPIRGALERHRAGSALPVPADGMFWRRTDQVIAERFGIRPFSVAADRIARTSHATLQTLEEVRRESGEVLPLGWSPDFDGVGVIEVYPAATLRAHGLWKVSPDSLQEELNGRGIRFPGGFDPTTASPHARDAVVCVLAAADFLRGEACPPSPGDSRAAEVEGWIWVKSSSPDRPHAP